MAGVKGSALYLPPSPLNVSGLFGQIEPYIRLAGQSGGITLSGGEALLQPEAAEELLKRCKEKNYHTAVETSGLLPLATYEKVLPLVDLWLLGMRLTTGNRAERHYRHMDDVLTLLQGSNAAILPRIPLVPGFFDREEVLVPVISLLRRHSIETVCLNPWNRDYALYYDQSGLPLRMAPPTPIEIEECEAKITSLFTHSNFTFYENRTI